MRYINYWTMVWLLPLLLLTSCRADDADNPTYADNELPHIYMGWQEKMALKLGASLQLTPAVSPSDGDISYVWTLNDEVIARTRELDYTPDDYLLNAELKLEVTRNGVSNHRVGYLTVARDFEPKEIKHKSIAWLTLDGRLEDVEWENISHLILSSAVVAGDGTISTDFSTRFEIDLLQTFAHHYGVYVLLEVSGQLASYLNAMPAYGSLNFYNAAVGDNRKKLLSEILRLVDEYHFDGINVYMDKATNDKYVDPAALASFYQELGNELKSKVNTVDGKEYDYLLSMNVVGGWTRASLADMVNIPTYDWINVLAFAAEDLVPGPHSSFDNAVGEVNRWLTDYSVAPSRIVLGTPAFGLRYFGTPTNYTWANLWEYTEYISYRNLCAQHPDAPSGNIIIAKENNGDAATEVDKTFYDGLNEVGAKAQWVVDNQLGGIALWAAEGDSKDEEKALLKRINGVLNE